MLEDKKGVHFEEAVMFVEGILVCINFDDFLKETLRRNRKFFDRLVICTSPEDIVTQDLAKKYDCDLVLSERYKENDEPFNKGKIINDGFDALIKKDMIMHLDADIVLCDDFRKILNKYLCKHGRHGIIGCQRYMVGNKKEWDDYIETGEHNWKIDKKRHYPNAPPGFVQIWNKKEHRKYPENHSTAHGSDTIFAQGFYPRNYLPCTVFHLATHLNPKTDHEGRVSLRWE
jgi:hypothetical protein